MSQKIKQDISIGKNLKRLRKRWGYTQEQVVAKLQVKGLSVSREMLSQMENGKYNIRVSILLALKDIYKCSTEDFFNDLQG
ncbi:helix-turn-helix transcriptional regulator [Acetivibrio sp. MSJd-27]|uniref:helix-turn-helix transcriptional regulator n=1 Tax=Acetivibrio sp. MSJd-27 TaxID=2841523 RepID=UPI001C115562|nr:helix-turn-helix transcriptional regulator [Acetivibrio sp. MSJd-27]MBU5449430.1 helix-turn-helix domain-containing protein [Acetivibrio sp. MSJd-27]